MARNAKLLNKLGVWASNIRRLFGLGAKSASYLLLNICWWTNGQIRRPRSSKPVQRVTALCLLGLGDWCPTLSLMQSLKRAFPGSKLSVITNELGAQFLSRQECVDMVVCLPEFRRYKVIRRILWLQRNRRRLAADLLVCPLWHRTHQLMACLLPHEAYYGYFRTTTPFQRREAHHSVPLESNVQQFRQALRALEGKTGEDLIGTPFGNLRELIGGLGIEPTLADFQVDEADRKWVSRKLAGGNERDHVVVLHPGSRWPGKGWPPQRWVETIVLLHQEFRLTVCLVGIAGEVTTCNEIEAALKTAHVPTLNLCASTTLSQLAALFQSTDLFLGTDSGTTHLASLMGTPAVALYGATGPHDYRPVRFKGVALHAGVECSPCGDNRCALSGEEKYRCMKAVEANRVFAVAKKMLGRSPSQAHT
jgi:heptosyltransferase I